MSSMVGMNYKLHFGYALSASINTLVFVLRIIDLIKTLSRPKCIQFVRVRFGKCGMSQNLAEKMAKALSAS
jgi:hypothetical protein